MNDRWLSANHVAAANKLLKHQFHSQNGLQDTYISTQKGVWASELEEFVQIVFISSNHWVFVSNKFSPAGSSTCSILCTLVPVKMEAFYIKYVLSSIQDIRRWQSMLLMSADKMEAEIVVCLQLLRHTTCALAPIQLGDVMSRARCDTPQVVLLKGKYVAISSFKQASKEENYISSDSWCSLRLPSSSKRSDGVLWCLRYLVSYWSCTHLKRSSKW